MARLACWQPHKGLLKYWLPVGATFGKIVGDYGPKWEVTEVRLRAKQNPADSNLGAGIFVKCPLIYLARIHAMYCLAGIIHRVLPGYKWEMYLYPNK